MNIIKDFFCYLSKYKNKYSIFFIGFGLFLFWFLFVNNFMHIHKFDHDEFAYMHVIWSVFSGRMVYADFWLVNSPFFFYFASLVWHAFGFGINAEIFFFFRYFSVIGLSLMLFLIFLIGTRLKSKVHGLIAAVFLAFNTVFVLKGVEIRPDPWHNVFLLLGFYFLIDNEKSFWRMFIVGILWGMAILFHFKAFFVAIAAFVVFILFSEKKKEIFAIFFGLASACIVLFFFLGINNLFYDFFMQAYYTFVSVVSGNVNFYDLKIANFIYFLKDNYLLVIFYLIGIFYLIKTKENKKYFYYFLFLSFLLLFESLFMAWFYQWYLQVLPIVSLIAAFGVVFFVNQFNAKKHFIIFLCFLLFLIFSFRSSCLLGGIDNDGSRLKKQVQVIDYVSENIPKTTKFFMFWNDIGGYSFLRELVHAWQLPDISFSLIEKDGPLYDGKYGYSQNFWSNDFFDILKKEDCGLIVSSAKDFLRFAIPIRVFIMQNYKEVFTGVWVHKMYI